MPSFRDNLKKGRYIKIGQKWIELADILGATAAGNGKSITVRRKGGSEVIATEHANLVKQVLTKEGKGN